jgi:autotransporter-associated beta strand protein
VFPAGSRYYNYATIDDVPGTVTVHNITFNENIRIGQSAGGSFAWLARGTIAVNVPAALLVYISMDIDLRTNPLMGDFTHYVTVSANEILSFQGRFTGSVLASLTMEGPGEAEFYTQGTTAYLPPTSIIAGYVNAFAYPGPTVFSSNFMSIAPGAFLETGGRVQLQIDSLTGSGEVDVWATTTSLTTGSGNASATFSGVIHGNGSLTKVGTGTFTLSGHNTYYTPTTIAGGTLQLGVSNALPSITQVNLATSGTRLDLNGFDTRIDALTGVPGSSVALGNGTLTLNGSASTTFSGVISGTGTLDKAGSSTLWLSGHNTYSGRTYVDSGILSFGADNVASSQSEVFVRGGTFDVNGHVETTGPLIGASGSQVTLGNGGSLTTGGLAGNGSINLGNGALLVSDYAYDSWQYDGIISGTGSLYKTGNSTLELDGNNTYTGSTTVVGGGTLLINGSLSPSSGILVNGATLSGTGTVGRFGTLGSAIIAPGSASAGTLTTGDGTFLGGATLRVRLNGAAAYDRLSSTGAVDLSNHPNLSVALNFTAAVGDQFTILTAGGAVTGNFNGLADGQVFAVGNDRFQIHYTAHSVVLTDIAHAATQLLVAVPGTSQAGAAFDFTVTAVDAGGHPDPLYTGTVHFSSQDPYGARFPVDYTFTSSDRGQHTFSSSATLFTAGTWDVTVSDTASGMRGIAGVQVTPAPAQVLVVTAPLTVVSGSPFDIMVTAQDPYGNTDNYCRGTVTFSTSDIDPGVVLPSDYTFQPSDPGSVTFPGSITLITPGDQQIAASDTMSGISGSATVTVSSGGSPGRGGRSRILLPWMGAPMERGPVMPSPLASSVSAPGDPRQATVEMTEGRAVNNIVGSWASVHRGRTVESADAAIDRFFLEGQL